MRKSCDFKCVYVRYQCCVIFACFLAVFLVFLTAQCQRRHTGSTGSARVFDNDLYLRTRACLLCIFVHHSRAGPTSLSCYSGSFLCALSLFIYFRFRSGISRWCAGDLYKTMSFVVGVLSTSFARPLLGLIHQSPSFRATQIRIFCNIIHVGLNVIWSNGFV